MRRLKAAARPFFLYLLPIYGFVLTLTGTEDKWLMWVLAGLAVVALILLAYADRISAYGRGVRDYIAATRALGDQMRDLGTTLETQRQEHRADVAALQAAISQAAASLTESVHSATDMAGYSAQRVLGARALYVDRMSRPVHFVHSHRPEIPKHDHELDASGVQYTVPAVPVDEAPFIALSTVWAMNTGPGLGAAKTEDAKVVCGCRVRDRDDPLLKESLVLIGSTLYNPATEFIEEAAVKRNWLHYRFGQETMRSGADDTTGHQTAAIFGVSGSPRSAKVFRPDPEVPAPPKGTKMRDYGLVTRIPNPNGPRADGRPTFVVIVAGCLLAGQLALTEWLAQPGMLHRLSVEHEDKPFQYVICVDYEYENAWDPRIDSSSIAIADQTQLHTPL
jgi:hypothetical protein